MRDQKDQTDVQSDEDNLMKEIYHNWPYQKHQNESSYFSFVHRSDYVYGIVNGNWCGFRGMVFVVRGLEGILSFSDERWHLKWFVTTVFQDFGYFCLESRDGDCFMDTHKTEKAFKEQSVNYIISWWEISIQQDRGWQ